MAPRVRRLPIRTQAGSASATVELRTVTGFDRFLRDRGRFTGAQSAVNTLHSAWAASVVTAVADELARQVKVNNRPNSPRPGSSRGPEGLRSTLRNRFDRFYDVTNISRSSGGFNVDFNRLDEYGPRDENGLPYWRYVLRPEGGGMAVRPGLVTAFFISTGGSLSVASGSRNRMDSRMPNFGGNGKMKPVRYRGFAGYDFIDPPVKRTLKEIKAGAAQEYLDNLNWPPEAMAAMRAAINGGYIGRGVVRDPASGTFTGDARIF